MTGVRRPLIGLVVPPGQGQVPDDARVLYPHVRFIAAGLGLERMAPDEFNTGLAQLEGAVADLLARGATAVSIMGTSLTFYRGGAEHEVLLERLSRAAAGIPTSTMSMALVRALEEVGATRVALVSAYTEDLAKGLVGFLDWHGVDVLDRRQLGISDITQLKQVSVDALVASGNELLCAHPQTDALVISCGGLDTLEAVRTLEERWRRPVLTSSQVGFWDIVRLADPTARSAQDSMLFQTRSS